VAREGVRRTGAAAALICREQEVRGTFERLREERLRDRPGPERDVWGVTGRGDGFEQTREQSRDRDDGFSFDR
jgi:hypothetical protein